MSIHDQSPSNPVLQMIEVMSASLRTSRFGTSTPSVVGAGSSPGSSSSDRVPGDGGLSMAGLIMPIMQDEKASANSMLSRRLPLITAVVLSM